MSPLRPVVLACLASAALAVFQPQWSAPSSITVYRNASLGNATGVLYAVAAPGYSDGPITVADLHGSHYEVGYLYATLFQEESLANYQALMAEISNSSLVQDILGLFLDWQYGSYLTQGLPKDFLDEQRGIHDAAAALNDSKLAAYLYRGMTLASIATGSVLFDLEYLIINEISPQGEAIRALLSSSNVSVSAVIGEITSNLRPLGRTCSMISAWGSRTVNGTLYTGRNLDWDADTGISKHKVVAVYHIPGKHSYASIGFAGLTGALTGMSAAGITVHETGNDNKEETLTGFAWSLRLRSLMENAGTIAEAVQFWEATNNTLGINHGVGSSADGQFLALESKAGYTAYFKANDPREAALVVNGTQYGFPMNEALWRTNHGYDPEFLSTVPGGPKPDGDSFTRYMLIHDTLMQYQNSNTLIGDNEALNITAVPGDKGGSSRSSFVNCTGPVAAAGSNIISAMFVPAQQIVYLAFENGHAGSHVPASCNTYVRLDLSMWF